MKNFNYYCNLHGSDKGDWFPNGNGYAFWYENWFHPLRNQKLNILEIGVQSGGSTQAFYDYFPNAQITGLDILDKSEYANDRITTLILDQSNPNQLDQFVSNCQKEQIQFDIILDDGSHDVEHQQLTLGKFFPLVKSGGIYLIEDMCTSYFKVGTLLYHYRQTQQKLDNNTVKFLSERPFSSPWIDQNSLDYIQENVEYISILDRLNPQCTYLDMFPCVNNELPRAITSVIKKR